MKKNKINIMGKPWFTILVGLILLSIISAFLMPAFLKLGNIRGILTAASTSGIMAIGLTFVIMTGGIDISIGGIVYLTAIIYCVSMVRLETLFAPGVNVFIAVVLAVGAATVAGALNGYLVDKFKMAPMITTLATLNVYKGIGLTISNGQSFSVPRYATFWGKGKLLEIPNPIIITVVAVIIGFYFLSKTRFGTYVRAIGNSTTSAEESHLPVRSTLIKAYLLAGLTAGIAGVIYVSRAGGLQGNLGNGIEFTVIAAVVLGGTKLIGGSGTVAGSIMGAIFLVIIDNILSMLGASPYAFEAVRGGILLFAVAVDRGAYVRQFNVMRKEKYERIREHHKH